jgi:ribosomal protein S18 acetylase RimI-like enzyme
MGLKFKVQTPLFSTCHFGALAQPAPTCFAMGKKNGSAKSKAKKEARKAEQLKKQAQLDTLRTARELANPLAALPAPFTAFKRNGLEGAVELHTGKTLCAADRVALHTILDENMAPIYGQRDWEEEAAADKQKELAESEARILIIRETATDAAPSSAAAAAAPATSTPTKTYAENAGSPTVTPVKAPCSGEGALEAAKKNKMNGVLGFLHFRYEIEEECLLLYIYELQIANGEHTRRKGLGKFFLMLAELLAKKSGFGGVMLTVQKTNEAGMKFYSACKYTPDSISPCKVDPMADAEDYSYEIYSKIWDEEVRVELERRGVEAKRVWDAQHDGRLEMVCWAAPLLCCAPPPHTFAAADRCVLCASMRLRMCVRPHTGVGLLRRGALSGSD